jgi:signal transduction histidine kinase
LRQIRRLFAGKDGALYVVSGEQGAHRCEATAEPLARRCTPVPGLEGANVYAFLEDRRGTRWFGTGTGIQRQEGDTVRRVTAGPTTDRPAFFLVEDPGGHLWAGTDDGVLRWDGQRLQHFTVEDGLAGRETNRAAGVVDSQGRLWIGTDAGVSIYSGEFDGPERPPRVELRTVLAGAEPRPLTESVEISPRDNDLTLSFRALSFRDEHRLQFQSWLEGFEEEWVGPYTSPRQELRYTNLPPGEYRFHLRAATAEGVWSEAVVSAPLVIAPHLWRRPWFVLTVALLATLLLIAVQRSLAQWRYAERLEKEVARRTRELAALNREKAEFLAIAAHDLRVPLVNLRGFAAEVQASLADLETKLQPHLAAFPEGVRHEVLRLLSEDLPGEMGFIDSSAARMDRLVEGILRLSRLERRELRYETLDMRALAVSIAESLAYRLEQHPAKVHVGKLPAAHADAMAMELVLQNLLSNAVTYLKKDRPGRIAVEGRTTDTEVIFSVADNGRGIAAKDHAKVFQIFGRAGRADTPGEGMGLAYVRALLRRHGGRVWFESSEGEGTVFYFALPAVGGGGEPPRRRGDIVPHRRDGWVKAVPEATVASSSALSLRFPSWRR